jgi:hypothetical protein
LVIRPSPESSQSDETDESGRTKSGPTFMHAEKLRIMETMKMAE